MKVLVVYYSETGNTEKVARAIHQEVSEKTEAHLKKLHEITPEILNDYDLVFLGSPCHSTDLAEPVKRFLDAVHKSPRLKLAGFFTHSVPSPESDMGNQKEFETWTGKCIASFQKACKEKGINFKGWYSCQGVPSLPIQQFIRNYIVKSDDLWDEYIREAAKHPSSEDLSKAREFARKVLSNS
ncbi:MAG: flavodoxin family protein [Candidatus Bathyarchaeia archaeon]